MNWVSGLFGLLGNSELDLSLKGRNSSPTVVYNQQENEKPNYTPIVIAITTGVVLLIIALFFFFKSKNK